MRPEHGRFVRILRYRQRRANVRLQRQFYDVTAEINTAIVKPRRKEALGFTQSQSREFPKLFSCRHYFNPASFPMPRIFILDMLPYCFIMRRMSAYCFST